MNGVLYKNLPGQEMWSPINHFAQGSAMNDPHLSVTPAHLAPPFHTALQADGAP